MNDLKQLIEQFAKDWQMFRDEKIKKKHPHHQQEAVTVKFNKLFAIIETKNGGAHAHVALCDKENKHIGNFKAGDIFKPATYNRPAKHKRGSVYDKNPLSCMTERGVK